MTKQSTREFLHHALFVTLLLVWILGLGWLSGWLSGLVGK